MKPVTLMLSCCLAALVPAHAAAVAKPWHPAPGEMRAQSSTTNMEVWVINGGPGTGGVAPALQSIPQLHHAPFTAYPQLTPVNHTTITIGATPATVSLPNGNSVTITLTNTRASGRLDVLVQLNLSGRSHPIHFVTSPGTPFFTAVNTGPDSAMILGFQVQ